MELNSGELVGAGCMQCLAADRANPLELDWRLRLDRWRQGLASEAARAMAGFALDTLPAPLLVAVCRQDNRATESVMHRLGMQLRGTEHWYDMDTLV